MSKHIILTGFMGAGKSTVGPRVAAELEVPWYDTDHRVEEDRGESPSEIIRTRGVPQFRVFELRALAAVLKSEAGVISTGGGMVSTPQGRWMLAEAAKATADVVLLHAPYMTLVKRCMADETNQRPLLADTAQAQNMYEARAPFYREVATAIVDATQPIELVVGDIVQIARAS